MPVDPVSVPDPVAPMVLPDPLEPVAPVVPLEPLVVPEPLAPMVLPEPVEPLPGVVEPVLPAAAGSVMVERPAPPVEPVAPEVPEPDVLPPEVLPPVVPLPVWAKARPIVLINAAETSAEAKVFDAFMERLLCDAATAIFIKTAGNIAN